MKPIATWIKDGWQYLQFSVAIFFAPHGNALDTADQIESSGPESDLDTLRLVGPAQNWKNEIISELKFKNENKDSKIKNDITLNDKILNLNNC